VCGSHTNNYVGDSTIYEAIATYNDGSAHFLKVNKSAQRAFRYIDPKTGKSRKVQEKFDNVKEEK
jgi:hypothetical protein